MKRYALIFLIFLLPAVCEAQTVQAEYAVSKDIFANPDGKGEIKLATLKYNGYLYRKGSKYIYFDKPGYLNTYPDGSIKIMTAAKSLYGVDLCMDTIQRLNFKDMDSLIKKYRMDRSGKGQVDFNYVQKFEADYFTWVMADETKMVNGLKCQKASLAINGFPQWVVWFTDKVPMQAGIDNIIGLPGLVVEAENSQLKTRYSLLTFTTDKDVADQVFNPAEFKQPFEKRYDMKKSNLQNQQQSKAKKLADLTNQ